ncbi:MAG: BrnT family toxin [Sulfuritalea sp.]|jgi:hypothetical protein|nr:BrnT family toxin [Sulfuritalea sp.]
MDRRFELNGTDFVWNAKKAADNPRKHDGVTFEQAATVFFDPFFRLVEAGRNDEARDAIIGFDATECLLFVVHVEVAEAFIRIISARRATNEERREHEHF